MTEETQEGSQLPAESEHTAEEEERSWRDVAQRWKGVGKQVRDLGERLASAFREGWETEEMTEAETRELRDRLRALSERMDRAVDAVRDEAKDPVTRARAKRTVQETRKASLELMSELQETLSEGLEDLNRRVDEIMEKRKQRKARE